MFTFVCLSQEFVIVSLSAKFLSQKLNELESVFDSFSTEWAKAYSKRDGTFTQTVSQNDGTTFLRCKEYMQRARDDLKTIFDGFKHVGSLRIHVAPRGTHVVSGRRENDYQIVIDGSNLEEFLGWDFAKFVREGQKMQKRKLSTKITR